MSGDPEQAVEAGWDINVSPARPPTRAQGAVPRLGPDQPVALEVMMAQLQACMAHDTSARLAD